MSVCELLHTVCVCCSRVCVHFNVCLSVQYVGDPVSLAISEAVLTVVEEEGMAVHAEQLGAYIQSQLRAMANKHPCIADIRYNMYNTVHNFHNTQHTHTPRLATLAITQTNIMKALKCKTLSGV